PPRFTITGFSSPRGTSSQSGNLIMLRNLALGPSQSFTATVSARLPCAAATTTWYFMARQGANFTGTTFALDASSKRTTKVTGGCHLAFSSQPADTHPNDAITDTAFDTGGGPVEVQVLDGLNNVLPVSVPI